jgi:hypothetical protein
MASTSISVKTPAGPDNERPGITNLFLWPTLILLILWNIFPLFRYWPIQFHELFQHRQEGADMIVSIPRTCYEQV